MSYTVAAEGVESFGFKPHVWGRRDYLRAYVGPSWEDFIGVFDEMKKTRLPSSWSWTLFFFPVIWLAYRRRYTWAIAVFVAMTLVRHFLSGWWSFGVPLAIAWFLGTFGRAIYVRSALDQIDAILALTPDQHQRVIRIQAKGGVSEKPVMIVLIAVLVIWLLAVFVAAGRF